MLKSVKVLFLNFKKINLPFINKMNRVVLLCVLMCSLLVACKKDNGEIQQAQIQLTIDTNIIVKYIKDNNLTKVVRDSLGKFPTGVFYKIDTLGTGSGLFTSSTLITVGYTGMLLGSTNVFAKIDKFHPAYSYGQMITGWQMGVKHIKKGGTIRLFIPSGFAYGPYEQPVLGLPANAILDFKIKLYDITN